MSQGSHAACSLPKSPSATSMHRVPSHSRESATSARLFHTRLEHLARTLQHPPPRDDTPPHRNARILASADSDGLGKLGGLANVRARRERHEPRLRVGRQLQRLDERAHTLCVDAPAARELLELLVRVLDAVHAHHGLDGLGEHLPVGVELGGEHGGVDLHLAEPLEQCRVRDHRVRERDSQVAHRRRVGQVALPARDGQLGRQVAEERVGDAHVALRVLKVDRVHLVRHRRRAHLARDHALLEVPLGDVAPHVLCEVEQHRVVALARVEELGDKVVRLDLRDVRVPREPERRHKLLRELRPVDVGARDDVRLVRAGRARNLAQDGHGLDGGGLRAQPVHDVGELFADRRRRRGLAVRVREHRHLGELVRHRDELLLDLRDRRHHARLARFGEHQRVREVVDVLRGAREVEELEPRRECRVGRLERLLQKVLDRLDVVVGGLLDRLDALRLLDGEVLGEGLERRARGRVEGRQLLDHALVREVEQPVDLDLDPPLDEGVLGEVLAQRDALVGVAAVDGRDRREGGQREVARRRCWRHRRRHLVSVWWRCVREE
mmetsp:Transcript_19257/g.50660  ORF Transcript_19257/g.50660 Transcript_19257/m.50660 type:complete len:553 (-) Transcript_19257:11-1669(-)